MSSPDQTLFVRRANPIGTTDSICTRCFVTVATATWEAELDRAEQHHVCDPRLLEYWKEMAARSPADGWDQEPPRPTRRRISDD